MRFGFKHKIIFKLICESESSDRTVGSGQIIFRLDGLFLVQAFISVCYFSIIRKLQLGKKWFRDFSWFFVFLNYDRWWRFENSRLPYIETRAKACSWVKKYLDLELLNSVNFDMMLFRFESAPKYERLFRFQINLNF